MDSFALHCVVEREGVERERRVSAKKLPVASFLVADRRFFATTKHSKKQMVAKKQEQIPTFCCIIIGNYTRTARKNKFL